MRVTILMSVFNGSQFLEETITSVLKQSYPDFQFLIINDGSTDNSLEVLNSFYDKRIKIIENEINKGNSYSLNKGILLADSEYIIRVDSDDICFQDRIEKQIHYMDENSSIGLSGSWFKEFGDGNKLYSYSSLSEELSAQLLFFNPIGHPTVIFRKDCLVKNNLFYNERFKFCEDYELWSRCKHFFRLGNLCKVLVNYRRHPGQISTKDLKAQDKEALNVKCKQIQELKFLSDPEEILYRKVLCKVNLNKIEKECAEILKLSFVEENKKRKNYHLNYFQTELNKIFDYEK